MATDHTCIQGASYAYDFTCKDIPTFDDNWSGSWAIIVALDDTTDSNDIVTLASGELTLSGDSSALEMRIKDFDTSPIPVGTYMLVVQVVNNVIKFSDELMQDTFEITKQGIL